MLFFSKAVSYNLFLIVAEVETTPTFLNLFFLRNFTVSSTILKTGILTEFLISLIKIWRELQGITIKSAPDFSNILASLIIKGKHLSIPIFLEIASFSIKYG